MHTCRNPWCKQPFEVTEQDVAMLDKLSPTIEGKKCALPPPQRCPDCRHALRMAFRNERHLYKRTCSHCGAGILSIYASDAPFPVHCYDCWWGDDWDALQYQRDIDYTRPFFDQFAVLFNEVPRLGIVGGHNENSDYCNYVNYSKNSYLCFGCHNVEDCFHCWRAHWSNSCVDCLQLDKGTLCYEVIDCDDCYNLSYSQDCTNCRDSAFLYDCRGCQHCIGCTGVRQGTYMIFNERFTKEEYEKRRAALKLHSAAGIEQLRKSFAAFAQTRPHRPSFIINGENAHGDHIINCRNVQECYHVKDAQDCRYLESCEAIKDSMDNTFSGWPAELVYETMSAGVHSYSQLFCMASWSSNHLFYCDSCHHSNNLFGCIGLRKKNQYCILNKQYTKEEYETEVSRLIQHMQKTGEFGSFFPACMSPHGYNETAALQFYPLSQEEAVRRGYSWKDLRDEKPEVKKLIRAQDLPDTIDGVPDDILHWAIECAVTRRPFRIVKQELDFYRKMGVPVPRLHPDERHRRRMVLRNPRKLWKRKCAQCQKPIETSYAPERPEIVYCESCYQKEVY